MIQPLRTWHRRVFYLLAAILPALFVGGLAARKQPPPRNPALPPENSGHALTWRTETRFALGSADVFLRESDDGAWLEIAPAGDPMVPDLLAYWSASALGGESLPPDAQLMGALAGARPRRLQLPRAARRVRGFLVFYSLAHRRAVGSVPLKGLP